MGWEGGRRQREEGVRAGLALGDWGLRACAGQTPMVDHTSARRTDNSIYTGNASAIVWDVSICHAVVSRHTATPLLCSRGYIAAVT